VPAVRIPIKPATDSTLKPATGNALNPATQNALESATLGSWIRPSGDAFGSARFWRDAGRRADM